MSGSRPMLRQLIPASQNSLLGLPVGRRSHPHLILNLNQFLKAHIIFVPLKKSQGGLQPKHRSSPTGATSQASSAKRRPQRTGFCRALKTRPALGCLGLMFLLGIMLSLLFIFCLPSLLSSFSHSLSVMASLFSLLLPPNLLTSEVPTLTLTGTLRKAETCEGAAMPQIPVGINLADSPQAAERGSGPASPGASAGCSLSR